MQEEIYSAAGLIEYIQQVGFLPLLNSGVVGYSAEEVVADDCRYVVFPEGGWDWPLWKWKGPIVTEGGCVYGKFFNNKAGFISKRWWPDFYNYRRSKNPRPQEGSIEDTILKTLQTEGSAITRELRALCGFNGTKMRSKFDGYITRLQMGCYVVTEDFVYPHDRHGNEYGWGWSLLTTPEELLGIEKCQTDHTAEESYNLIARHIRQLQPHATDRQIQRLIG
jgi:hypothetical protein